ncbi:2,3-diketo-5-methylthiopentyl-1-phosphate enolase [Candidatus Sumerlaeota bacterium]|nr:2,3-diketo-5-methylthiopentyl-1-phosphate enolase [Candidatus Sumerlaeota bacterium]
MMIEVDYRFPRGVDAKKQAGIIAIGQTAGTWSVRHQHREGQLRAHLAKVIALREEHDGASIATVAFPRGNVEGDIASLLTMIFGKYSMAGAGRIVAVRLPVDYGVGAKFGISGLRGLTGIHQSPVVMAIFKPALGLSAEDHADILREVAEAGLSIIKDDEIMPDVPEAPTIERLRACRRVIDETKSSRGGRELLYALNLTGRADQLLAKARRFVDEGANAFLLNVLTYGFSVMEALAADPAIQVPIFAHPALAGAIAASPDHGIAYPVILGTLMAHCGADAVLYPAHYGSLPFNRDDEFAIRDSLRSRGVFPVPSAGIMPKLVPQIVADYGIDVILNAGTGIMDHEGGPAGGVKAFQVALANIAADK